MTIRVRLTALVTVLTTLLSVAGVSLGATVLQQLVSDRALEEPLELAGFWSQEAELETGTDLDELRLEIESLFSPIDGLQPALSASTIDQLFDTFAVDDVLYVAPLTPIETEVGVVVAWPVDRTGMLADPLASDQLDSSIVIVASISLLELAEFAWPEPAEAVLVEDPAAADLLDQNLFDEDLLDENLFDDDLSGVPAAGEPNGIMDADGLEPGADRRLVFDQIWVDGRAYAVAADVTSEVAAIDEVIAFLRYASIAIVGLAALATWITSGRALAPVEALTRQVDEISSSRLRDRLPGSQRDDEIGRLAATLNRMLERLDASDRQRRRFVSDASHELRTPLAVLTNQAEVARSAPHSTSVDHLAAVMETETSRLTSVVEDLLILARHDELTVDIGTVPGASGHAFDLDDVVLAEVQRPRRLPVDTSAVSAGRVLGDPLTAARAIGHLLDNAARHGSVRVAVGLTTIGDHVRLAVDDDGDGIPESKQDQVFERFTRLDESRTRDAGGAGLGLAVVKATFAAMGGHVTIQTSPLGGARFLIELPATSA